jgi:peptide chain release factor 3
VKQVRTGKEIRLSSPVQFIAAERVLVEQAFAGDVIGITDAASLEIGDTVTDGAPITFEPIPSFAPEHFARASMTDPMRRKQLQKGVEQLALEGTIQLYRQPDAPAGDFIVGAVGQLQLEVMKYRLKHEDNVDVRVEPTRYSMARWVARKDGGPTDLRALKQARAGICVVDVAGRAVMLFESPWEMRSSEREFPDYAYSETATAATASAR